MYGKGKNNPQFVTYINIHEHMGHTEKKQCSLLAIRRALGGPSIIRQYQSTYSIWKHYVQDFFKLSYSR